MFTKCYRGRHQSSSPPGAYPQIPEFSAPSSSLPRAGIRLCFVPRRLWGFKQRPHEGGFRNYLLNEAPEEDSKRQACHWALFGTGPQTVARPREWMIRGARLAFSSNPMHRPLPLFSPVPASGVFYGFLPQSLRVIFQKFMAASLTHSICSPKLGSVEKSIRQVPFRARIRSSANKQEKEKKNPSPRNQTDSPVWHPVLEHNREIGYRFKISTACTDPGEPGAQ